MGHRISPENGEILCDCELIQRDEVERFLKEEKVKDLQDILHRTRLAKGTCQGGFCIYRLLGMLHDLGMAEGNYQRSAERDSLRKDGEGSARSSGERPSKKKN